MAIGDDFQISAAGAITHTSGTSTYSVLEFHRWLADLADDAVAAGNDLVDITDLTPSDRSTDNIITLLSPYWIDDTAAEFLYDGSISQTAGSLGDAIFAGLVVVGSVETGTELQIVQDNATLTSYWGTGLNADAANNILLRIMVKVREFGADIDRRRLRVQARELSDTYAEFNVTMGLGNNTAAIFTSDDLNNQTSSGTIATWDQFGNTEGLRLLDINNDTTDEEYYSEWDIGGGATPATPTINDLYEYTKYVQRRGTAETNYGMNGFLFRGVTHSIVYDGEAGGPFTQNEVIVWGTDLTYDNLAGGTFAVGDYVSIGGASGAKGKVLYDNGSTNMIVALESITAYTILNNDEIAELGGGGVTADVNVTILDQDKNGGEGALLALDDDGTTGNLYIQILTGAAPVDDLPLRGRTSGATALVNTTVTARTVKPEFIGQSTGSAIIGAYGVGISPGDLTQNDLLFDLTGTSRQPPNNVQFTVGGLVSGEDRVLVGPRNAGVLQFDQFGLQATLSTDNITAVQIDATIPSDTPSPTGYIRVFDDNGIARRLHYSSYATDTFVIDTSDGNEDFNTVNATAGNDVFIAYVDELAGAATATFTAVYASDRALFVRVRDGGTAGDNIGIKTFEAPATFGSSPVTVAAIRTPDA